MPVYRSVCTSAWNICAAAGRIFMKFDFWLHWSIKFNFSCPTNFSRWLSSTFYVEFRYVYRIYLSGKISKLQRNLNVQNSTLRAHETGRNFPLNCRGIWLSPIFSVRYIPVQCPAIVCQYTWGPLAMVPLFHNHNVLMKSFTVFITDFTEIFWEKSKWDSKE